MKETTRTKIVNWLRDNPKRLPVPKSWIIEQLSKSLNLSHDYLNNLLTTMNVEGLIKIKPFRSNHEWTSLVVLSEYVTEGFNIANSKQLEDWWYNEGKVLFEKLKG